jgi:hypothetical protein
MATSKMFLRTKPNLFAILVMRVLSIGIQNALGAKRNINPLDWCQAAYPNVLPRTSITNVKAKYASKIFARIALTSKLNLPETAIRMTNNQAG